MEMPAWKAKAARCCSLCDAGEPIRLCVDLNQSKRTPTSSRVVRSLVGWRDRPRMLREARAARAA
jgi:hypothetical protein